MRAMIKRILIATDGSDPAVSAEELGLFWAKRLDAEALALFVKDVRLIRAPEILDFGAISIPVPAYHEALDQALEARGQAVLEAFKRRAEAWGVKRVELLLRTGVPYQVIVEEARAADLAVLGRAGEQLGHEATGVGSTVERVARTSPVPVMVAALEFTPVKRILVGYDGSDLAVRALHFIVDLAPGLEVVVVSVADDPDKAAVLAGEGVEYLAAHGVKAGAEALTGDPGEALVEFQEPSDLLAMGAFGRGRVVEMLLGSTTEFVLRRAVGPVLLVR